MIAQLSGTLVDKGLDVVVVDVGGVGFTVHVSLTTRETLPQPGQAVKLLTHLQVREDALTLYGFATADERRAFELCLSVTGIGPKLALSALSGLGASGLAEAIAAEDTARLSRVPGIGKKTAERLVMELRDKFKGAARGPATKGPRGATSATTAFGNGVFSDVVSALCNLGYKPADAERSVEQILEASKDSATPPPIEEVLRRSLRALQRD